LSEIPIPLVNYVNLIKTRRSPYYDIAQYVLKDMENYYTRTSQGYEVIYTANPRTLRGMIERKISDEKITTVNICRTILALLYGSKLNEKDFYVTTTSCGRKNYHIKVNGRTLNWLSRLL
jgi:hypothetical protein